MITKTLLGVIRQVPLAAKIPCYVPNDVCERSVLVVGSQNFSQCALLFGVDKNVEM